MDMRPQWDLYPDERGSKVDRQIEVHLVGAHVCLTKPKRGHEVQRVWVTWLPRESPHVAVCGVLFGRRFRLNVALWPRPEC